jgi:hypothetical protein
MNFVSGLVSHGPISRAHRPWKEASTSLVFLADRLLQVLVADAQRFVFPKHKNLSAIAHPKTRSASSAEAASPRSTTANGATDYESDI